MQLVIILACVFSAFASNPCYQQGVTLHTPQDKATGKYDEARACFSFKYGLRNDESDRDWHLGGDWDLGYGFVIGDDDWFILNNYSDNRTVIKDLGALNWSDSIHAPPLEPLPLLPKAERRPMNGYVESFRLLMDLSGNTNKSNIMAKVVIGHMYLMRLKDEETDLYAMFRVEKFVQGSYCRISWALIPSPQ